MVLGFGPSCRPCPPYPLPVLLPHIWLIQPYGFCWLVEKMAKPMMVAAISAVIAAISRMRKRLTLFILYLI